MKEVSISTTVLSRQGTEDFALPTGLEMISQAGFTHIELRQAHSDWLNVAPTIKNLELRVWACHGRFGFASVSKDPSVRRRALQDELIWLEQAAGFAPCPYVIHYLNRFADPD